MGAMSCRIAAVAAAIATAASVELVPLRSTDWLGALEASSSSSAPLREIAALEFQEAVEAWQGQNLLWAMQLFQRSAQKGYEVGEYCFRLGQYHELSPANVHQALRWYSRGARMQHVQCTTMLGKLRMAMGQLPEARELLSRTAAPRSLGGEHGDSLAQWFLAELSLKTGQLRDAVRWWKRSAENGDPDAMMRLWQVFSEGAVGIPRETTRARHWFLAAAAHGHQEALNRLDWNVPDRPPAEQRWIDHMARSGWL